MDNHSNYNDDDNDNEENDEYETKCEKDFNDIIKYLNKDNNLFKKEELKDRLRNFYQEYNTLNHFIEYYQNDTEEVSDLLHALRMWQKEFFQEFNSKPDDKGDNSN